VLTLFRARNLLDGRAFQRDPLPYLQQLGEQGDVVFFKAGLSEFALIRAPDLIQRILTTEDSRYGEGKWTLRGKYVMRDCMITREGEAHRERRKLMQPAFGKQALGGCGPEIVRRTLRLSNRWMDGQACDIFPDLAALALEIVGQSLFSTELEGQARELNRALSTMLHAIPRLPLPRPRLMAARRLVARTADAMSGGYLISLLRQAGLSAEQIRDEIVSLLIASVDTTPKTLAWIFCLLGSHKDVEERVHAELAQVSGNREPTAEDIPRLEYLNRVINETLRLYPPVHFIDRRPLEDLDLNGTKVKAGTYLLLCPLLTHRDPRYFESPNEFRTDRWTQEETMKRPRFSFFPFGAGTHACIGAKLASLELVLVSATLAQRWRFRPAAGLLSDPSPQRLSFPMILESRP
jgi:cytochrome P450